mmetsp:Transcript_58254/g.126578  ORF Transcript_58254/g.126578 Transcript_58254/m.126578 type:complete len:84 (-) Transcript_58254:16-267(-)
MSQPSRSLVLSLFRSMIRSSRNFTDYNFNSFARRRIRIGFARNSKLEGSAAAEAYQEGIKQLGVVQRQAVVSSLYPDVNSVMK